MTEQSAYKLLARRVIGQAFLDAETTDKAAELLTWIVDSDFSIWCAMAEVPELDTADKIRWRIYHDADGNERDIGPFQKLILSGNLWKIFKPGRSLSDALSEYETWIVEQGYPRVKLSQKDVWNGLRRYGISTHYYNGRSLLKAIDPYDG